MRGLTTILAALFSELLTPEEIVGLLKLNPANLHSSLLYISRDRELSFSVEYQLSFTLSKTVTASTDVTNLFVCFFSVLYFKIMILESGEKKLLGMGVMFGDEDKDRLPSGWKKGSVGYYIDWMAVCVVRDDGVMGRAITTGMVIKIGCLPFTKQFLS